MNEKLICLNMIVKNESKVIQRCLASVKDAIDYWVIVDTGSSDHTQEIILNYMKGIPGELHECEWVNFEYNRNQALQIAFDKANYILMLDADDTLEFSNEFDKRSLCKEGYYIFCRDPIVDSYRLLMIQNHRDWKWEGVLHEALAFSHAFNAGILQGVIKNGLMRDGERGQDPERYLRDAEILEKELKKDPQNPRLVFYLAQSYATANESVLAIQYYEQRAAMGGYEDEVFWSLYFSACLKDNMKMDPSIVIMSYWKAYEYNRKRAEPLCYLARFLLKIGNPALAYLAARVAVSIPRPLNLHFIQRDVYDYASLMYFAYSQHLLHLFDDAAISYHKLLKIHDLPKQEYNVIRDFLTLCERKMPIQVIP